MTDARSRSAEESPGEADLDDLLDRLENLEESIDDPEDREELRRAVRIGRRIPGQSLVGDRIRKYTTRDVAEGFVGGVLLSLPLLVEDGVFAIADWFVATTVAGVPAFLVAHLVFVVLMVIGLLYWSDIRDVGITKPLFGIVPRRLVGVLATSLLTAAFLLVLWGRHLEGDPTGALEVFGRISVVWAAAAFGAALGDILPGESRGTDVTLENIGELVGD